MLASTTSVVVLGSMLSLASAAPTRSSLFSFSRQMAKRTSASDTTTFADQVTYPAACVGQCKEISLSLEGCYDQDSCAPACAPGQYDQLTDCYNCFYGVQNAADFPAGSDNATQAVGSIDMALGEYLEKCTALHYFPLAEVDNSVPILTATPTGTAEPEYATLDVTATKLNENATITITPIPLAAPPTASASASSTA